MKHIQILIILILWTLTLQAQTVHLNYKNQSLDRILLDLRDDYGIDLSFSNDKLSKYIITIDRDFSSPAEALEFLLKKKPFELQEYSDVYLIKQIETTVNNTHILSATLVDKKTGERLPYAHLLVNSSQLTTRQDGTFTVNSKTDSLFNVKISYLGFYPCDTTLQASVHHKILLQPISYEIEEITVRAVPSVHKTGKTVMPGTIRLNSFVTNFLPGNGDQSVFNLLRLQPGILAAGEQSADILIWGSYEGQSKLILDGIPLFSMKNYNDNISTINPLMVKDMKVSKGGYGIEYDGRVGGIVDVTAKDGSMQKLKSTLNINNQTVNGLVSVPLFSQQASLLVALRQTYYELYDQSNITVTTGRNQSTSVDRILYPDYNFRDLNIKLSGEISENTNYLFHFLRGKDDFAYNLNLDGMQSNFVYEDSEQNTQTGWSALVNHSWRNGMTSRIRFSDSKLDKIVNNQQQIGRNIGGSGSGGAGSPFKIMLNDSIENHIHEHNAEFETNAQLGEKHHLKWIIGWNQHHSDYIEDSLDINLYSVSNKLNTLNLRLSDSWSVTRKLNINAGLLYDRTLEYGKNLLQPRISLKYDLHKNLDVSFSYGAYSQFITQMPLVDDFNHIRYFWMVSDFDKISVQRAIHKVMAFNYQLNGLKFDVNFFQRNTTGLTRFREYAYYSEAYNGESLSNGFDILLSKTFKNLNFWLAYTYSKTLEHFDYFTTSEFERALHDQRHELKGAIIYNLHKWHFSANYVYGSGFPDLLEGTIMNDYQRLDIAVNRGFSFKSLNINAGFSILNVLNHENIKYDNFYRLVDEEGDIILHAEAVPLTPTIYLNLSF